MAKPTATETLRTPDTLASAPKPYHRLGLSGWSERAFLAILVFVFVITGFVPGWRHLNSDFPNYYLIARLYREGYPLERVYEWTWLQRQKDHRGIDQPLVSFIPSTLPSALMVMPWSSLPPLAAKRWWLVTNLGMLLLTGALLTMITTLNSRRIALLMFLATIPLRDSFLYGQMHIWVLFLFTFAAYLYFRDSFFLSGIVLAIAATMKIYPALFLIFFVFKKQWRAALGLVAGLSSAAVISIYLFGRNACLLYMQEILPRALRGETIDPYNVAWNSLTALLRRLLIAEPELNPTPVSHAPALYAFLHPLIHGFIFVIFMWAIGSKSGEPGRRKLEWAAYLFLLLLLSSQPGPYHFVVLILAAILAFDYFVANQQTIAAGSLVAMYALICGPMVRLPQVQATGWSNLFFFQRLTLMLLLGGVLLWVLIELSPDSLASRVNVRTWMLSTSVLIALVVIGFSSNMRHLNGQFDNYKSRVVTIPASLMASDPAFTSQGLLFTGMTRGGYAIRRLSGGAVEDFIEGRGNWFHPAGAEHTDGGWAEQSSGAGSRTVRFSSDASTQELTSMTIEIEHSEQPVLSPDGELLVFIRAINGRGSLWVGKMGNAHAEGRAAEHEVAGATYDVREATIAPDHRIIFSARSQGRFALYMAEQTGGIQEMSAPSCSARYPAISHDAQWIAFSCEDHGSWQLYMMSLRTREEWQLTNTDCNSISPAWTPDAKHIVYATDCGRGLGLTALTELTVFP